MKRLTLLAALLVMLAGCGKETIDSATGKFHQAIGQQDWPTAKRMLDTFPSIANTKPKDGNYALTEVCDSGDVAMVRYMLEKGADPNIGSRDADLHAHAPMFGAIGLSHPVNPVIVKLLLDHGANPNGESVWFKGYSYLMGAVELGPPEAVQAFLDKGANPNAVDADGVSVLEFAIVGGNPAIIIMLLAKGADASVKDTRGHTPLQWAEFLGGAPERPDGFSENDAHLHSRATKAHSAEIIAVLKGGRAAP